MRTIEEIMAFVTDDYEGLKEEEFVLLQNDIITGFLNNNPKLLAFLNGTNETVDTNDTGEIEIIGGDPDEQNENSSEDKKENPKSETEENLKTETAENIFNLQLQTSDVANEPKKVADCC